MAKGNTINYSLRLNKAVDRELFLSALTSLSSLFDFKKFRYVGMGGPFMEEYRLLHNRLGIQDLISCEKDPDTHLRQKFNSPFNSIGCVHSAIEEYYANESIEGNFIIWLDYTEPSNLRENILFFCSVVCSVKTEAFVRITLNASPTSLGDPKINKDEENKQTFIQAYRLESFKSRMHDLSPADLSEADLVTSKYGALVLKCLLLKAEKEISTIGEMRIAWILSTFYADGQPMVTALAYVYNLDSPTNFELALNTIKNWEFRSDPFHPIRFDLPSLSTRERLFLEKHLDGSASLDYNFEKSSIGQDIIISFRNFHKFIPHFSRIDL